MPLFKRRRSDPPAQASPPGRQARRLAQPRREETDWRSYDPIAEIYARVQAPRTALPAADLVAVVGVAEGARVLDVGTGTGVLARAAGAAAGDTGLVVGIDPSLPMLRSAMAERGPGMVTYAAAEAIDLPFRASSFDVVMAGFAIAHFAKAETALFDMLRVLRSGGRMGVSTWGAGEDEFSGAWNEVAEEFAEQEIMQDAYDRAMPSWERFRDPGKLKDVLHEAGLRDIRIDRREYRFQMTAEEYLQGCEVHSIGRFLRQMLGEEYWETFRRRSREVFAERFPPAFNDFRDVILVAGHKP